MSPLNGKVVPEDLKIKYILLLYGVIDFRSASRVGYSDLGANRKRMEAIRKEFNRAIGQSTST